MELQSLLKLPTAPVKLKNMYAVIMSLSTMQLNDKLTRMRQTREIAMFCFRPLTKSQIDYIQA